MNKTGIAWTDRTWNCVTGCTKVSAGCKFCYAERIFARPYPGRAFTDVRTHPDRLEQPLRIKKPQRIFVNSMSDLFHEDVPFFFIDKVFAVAAKAGRHTFQVLTKRPQRMKQYFDESRKDWYPVSNVWLGVSVEDQETANERIPLLLQTPAAVRFVSYEPALGPVDFTGEYLADRCGGRYPFPNLPREHRTTRLHLLDWVIVGGESGPRARPFNIQWARSTVEQCKAAGTACFVKQMGSCPGLHVSCNDLDDALGLPRNGDPDKFYPLDPRLNDRAGADPSEWPVDLRVQEFPK